MKFLKAFWVITSLTLSTTLALAVPNGSLSDTNIQYFGRWDFSNASQYASYWGGAYVRVNFSGTTAKIILGHTSNYHIKIDGGAWVTLTNVSGTVTLTPEPLVSGVHTLSVAQGADYDYDFNFQGFIFDNGATTSMPTIAPQLIEFIGDSITCGYTDPQSDVSDYAWICAEKLNCEHTQIAYPGITLLNGYGVNSVKIGMDVQYFKAQSLANPNSPSWNFTNYTPNYVVINLGQNDGGAGEPDGAFQNDYTNFLAAIRNEFPNAKIFAMRPFSGLEATAVQAAVASRNLAGDPLVYYIDTTGWLSSSDFNDGVHPSVNGQIKAANYLKAALGPYLGGDVVGKVVVGYQGWFSAAGDGSPVNAWGHDNLEMWPDVREYVSSYTGCPFDQGGVGEPSYYGNLGNGQPATMYSGYDQQVVDTHFTWMAQNDIDCVALQRFCNEISPGSILKSQRDGMALKVMNAALATGRKFYIEYDASGNSDMDAIIKADWTNTITGTLQLTTSPAYARQNGKPVVGIYGIGYATAPDPGPGSTNDCMDIINFLKAHGCYIMGGVPGQWRTGTGDSATNFSAIYQSLDMIGPWAVGRATDSSYLPYLTADFADCNSNGMDYLPNAYPGTSFYNSNGSSSPKNQFPRYAGNFLWTQFSDMRYIGAHSVFIAMFDEMNEATSIFECAEDASMIPSNYWFLTLDADGTHCSSDFYLRLSKDGGDMIKRLKPYSPTLPTEPVLPVSTPAPPTGLYTVGASNQVTVIWSASPGATGYYLSRSTVNGGPYTSIGTNIGHLSYTDKDLVNGATYYYVCSTTNSVGLSIPSIQVSGIPFAGIASASSQSSPAEGAVQAFDGLTTTKWFNNNAGAAGWLEYYFGGPTQVVVGYSITSANDNPAQDPKDWQFQGSQNGFTWTTLDTETAQAFSNRYQTETYAFSNVTAYAYYRLNITANNGDPSGIQLSELAFIYGATVPTGVTANAFSSSQIQLSWTPSAGAASYNVKRSSTMGGPYTNVATGILAPFYWDSGVESSATYYYVISAVNSAGDESANSAEVIVTSLFAGPAAPTEVYATVANGQVGLIWNPVVSAITYNVWRATTLAGPYSLIAAGVSGLNYNDADLTNGITYYYAVSAVNGLGTSANSVPVSAIPTAMASNISFKIGTFSNDSVLSLIGPPARELYGVGFGGNGGTTANGYTFGSDPDANFFYNVSGVYTAFLNGGGTSGDTVFDTVLNNGRVGSGTGALILSNLVVGAIHQVLFLEADTRSGMGTRTFAITSGGLSSAPQSYAYMDGSPYLGGYVLCTFTATAPTQAFANAEPTYGYQLNALLVGTAASPSTTIPVLTFGVGNGQLQFVWPSDHIGWTLEEQTNAPGAGLGTNWHIVPNSTGTNQMSFPLDNINGSIFFRLAYP